MKQENINTEALILSNILTNEEFARIAIPNINPEYFGDSPFRSICKEYKNYFTEWNKLPSKETLIAGINESQTSHNDRIDCLNQLSELYAIPAHDHLPALIKESEKWCQDKEMYRSILKAIAIYDGTDKTKPKTAIPDMMRDALSVTFSPPIGLDLFDDAGEWFDEVTSPEHKIPFGLNTLNEITHDGVTRKTLNLILAGVHVGKTLMLCHLSADYVRLGYKVLYCSMEMSERDISHRIYANLIKTPLHEIKSMDRELFLSRLDQLKSRGIGSFKTIQFTTCASTMNFKAAINELKTKQNWMPDIVVVDYLGITSSYRVPRTASNQTYSILTSVSEELRDLAIEEDIVVWSAQQLNREGMKNLDKELTDIAGSIGITGTVDFVTALIRNEESDSIEQILCKQLKNRYRKTQYRPKFVLGCDFDQQLLSDVSENKEPEQDPEIDSKFLQAKAIANSKRKRRNNFSGVDVGSE